MRCMRTCVELPNLFAGYNLPNPFAGTTSPPLSRYNLPNSFAGTTSPPPSRYVFHVLLSAIVLLLLLPLTLLSSSSYTFLLLFIPPPLAPDLAPRGGWRADNGRLGGLPVVGTHNGCCGRPRLAPERPGRQRFRHQYRLPQHQLRHHPCVCPTLPSSNHDVSKVVPVN